MLKAIWSEEYLIISTIILSSWIIPTCCPTIMTVSSLIMWFDHRWFSCAIIDIDLRLCISKAKCLSIGGRLRVMTFNWTAYQTLSDFIFLQATVCLLQGILVVSTSCIVAITVISLILLLLIVMSACATTCIEVLTSASIIWNVEVFNAWGPLSLGVSHTELISLLIRGGCLIPVIILRLLVRLSILIILIVIIGICRWWNISSPVILLWVLQLLIGHFFQWRVSSSQSSSTYWCLRSYIAIMVTNITIFIVIWFWSFSIYSSIYLIVVIIFIIVLLVLTIMMLLLSLIMNSLMIGNLVMYFTLHVIILWLWIVLAVCPSILMNICGLRPECFLGLVFVSFQGFLWLISGRFLRAESSVFRWAIAEHNTASTVCTSHHTTSGYITIVTTAIIVLGVSLLSIVMCVMLVTSVYYNTTSTMIMATINSTTRSLPIGSMTAIIHIGMMIPAFVSSHFSMWGRPRITHGDVISTRVWISQWTILGCILIACVGIWWWGILTMTWVNIINIISSLHVVIQVGMMSILLLLL